ncbi:hypothetical protein TIFTF001_031121 [Ficus carica]|uniref:Uncharacterized protein n=1 Tax=Ficus carica TaxID=3494 RepID=A0AA88J4Q5_FICCA|nr:hypothetical protein TIFTF001_031121 [Ficus carica]
MTLEIWGSFDRSLLINSISTQILDDHRSNRVNINRLGILQENDDIPFQLLNIKQNGLDINIPTTTTASTSVELMMPHEESVAELSHQVTRGTIEPSHQLISRTNTLNYKTLFQLIFINYGVRSL